MRKKLPLISGILNVLEKLKGNTGIIENTSVATHTIAAGKYVIWKNDLYKASSAISIGDTLSLSNLTAVSDGIANELNSNLIGFPDYSNLIDSQITNNWTATADCYVNASRLASTGANITVNGNIVSLSDSTSNIHICLFSGILKKGDILQCSNGNCTIRAFGIK